MALVPKIDPNKIFASNAPTQDKPAAFDNYEKGMDETRKNLGRPTIPQLNYLHQTADQKILWIHQNGGGLPYDASIEYAEKSVTLKDGELKQLVGGAWVEVKTKALPATAITTASSQNQQQINDYGGAKWYAKVGGYELGATVKLDNGDTVQSTAPSNTVNPNVDMTGWVLATVLVVESVADMLAIQNPKDGKIVFTTSYIKSKNKGAAHYKYNAVRALVNDAVSILNGWERVSELDIYSGGLLFDGTDEKVALQRTYNAYVARSLEFDLCGNTVCTTALDVEQNSVIKNGTIDVTAYAGAGGRAETDWRRTPIMLKTNDRNSPLDFEYSSRYSALTMFNNVEFRNVNFVAHRRLFVAYKFNTIKFVECTFKWNSGEIINMIGGWEGADLSANDTDIVTNIIDPINGRNSNITFLNCKFEQLTPFIWGCGFHIVASEDVVIDGCEFRNVPLSSRTDTWNRRVTVRNNKFLFTDSATITRQDTDSVTKDSDYIGIYMGQNSYEYDIYSNTFDGIYRPIYIEAASRANIYSNIFKSRIGNRWWVYAINIQGNKRFQTKTNWGNSDDIAIQANTFISWATAINCISALPEGRTISHHNISVTGNIFKSTSGQAQINVNATDNFTLSDNSSLEGWVRVVGCSGAINIANNTIRKVDSGVNTYPIYMLSAIADTVNLNNNTLVNNYGVCMRFESSPNTTFIVNGGFLKPSLVNNFYSASNVKGVIGKNFGVDYKLDYKHSPLVELAAGASMTSTIAASGVRYIDEVSVYMQNVGLHIAAGRVLSVFFEPSDGGIKLSIRNTGTAAVNFSPVFFVHVSPSMASL